MSDDRDGPAASNRDGSDSAERQPGDGREPDPDDPRERDRSDEPLGDLAAEIRNRTGRRRADDRDAVGPTPGDGGDRTDRSDREGPLADVAAAVDERRRGRDGPDAFDAVDVDELDGEALWERLAEGEGEVEPGATPATQADDGAEWSDGRDVRTIPKATCHGCPHFGEPPELACTHEGTDILAMPDAEHFRVAGCPMVGDEEADIGSIAESRPDE